MNIEPIHNKETHDRALKRIEALWDAPDGSEEQLEFDALVTLVEAYEKKICPISLPDPIEAINVRCEDLGWSRQDLEPLLGTRARVSEVLNRKRPLTLAMIEKLHEVLGIPYEVLMQGTHIKASLEPESQAKPSMIPSSKRAKKPAGPKSGARKRRTRLLAEA